MADQDGVPTQIAIRLRGSVTRDQADNNPLLHNGNFVSKKETLLSSPLSMPPMRRRMQLEIGHVIAAFRIDPLTQILVRAYRKGNIQVSLFISKILQRYRMKPA